ncbi:MAG TPA: glutathione S-transferase N-terminal domain-containing protein [Gammaproteobacteria bacterium]|nr:glutathione S-transferase N-terminal domain-containing protein [Gammaproteobacteria bacterium]
MTANVPHALIGESFSPWTQKARWALEYCGVSYRYAEYTPTLSEPWLRWRMRQWSGSVSVPVLFVGKQVLRGSWDIAEYASKYAGDGRLGDFVEVAKWNELSELALAEGRARVVNCVRQSRQALDEAMTGLIPRPLHTPLRFVARTAAQRLDRKYAHLVVPGALRRALLLTRAGLAESASDYLLGRFSYADIVMVVILEMIAPVARTEPPLGPATKQCWSDPALVEEFADLVQWRNRLATEKTTSFSQFQHLSP